MAQRATAAEWEFLKGLDTWVERGHNQSDYPGLDKSSITKKLYKFGLRSKRTHGLIDARDGTPLLDLLAQGKIVVDANDREEVAA